MKIPPLEKISENQEALSGEEVAVPDQNNHSLMQFICENNEIFTEVDAPREASMDAVCMRNLSKMCRQRAENMTTNMHEFRMDEFGHKIKTMLGVEENAPVDMKKWVLLGQTVKKYIHKSPSLTYMFGALDTVPPEPKEKKTRETKSKQATKASQLQETQAAVIKETTVNANQTDVIVSHVFKCAVTQFKINNKQPFNYFKFVINPECFGTSVENMFHVSFLIKEGKVGISICGETGDPLLHPLTSKQMTERRTQNDPKNQVVLSFSQSEWSQLIKKYQIKDSLIESIE